jgi:hypothetical protein
MTKKASKQKRMPMQQQHYYYQVKWQNAPSLALTAVASSIYFVQYFKL